MIINIETSIVKISASDHCKLQYLSGHNKIVYSCGSYECFRDGIIHNEGSPARKYDSGTEEWFFNGLPHRDNGPAVSFPNGTKLYYVKGLPHRLEGPAIEWFDGDKLWFKNGVRHRDDGPAVDKASCKEFWYLGRQIKCEDTKEFLRILRHYGYERYNK
jgi:hypothetical protein